MPKANQALPLVSVILPIRNEVNYIYKSLAALVSQDYPLARTEVIIADGMSSDGTREIVQSFQDSYVNVRLINNLGRIAPTALNAAISQAQGEIIIRVDGHCELSPSYVRRCVEHLRNGDVDVVGGPLLTLGDGYVARGIALAMSSRFGVGDSSFRTSPNTTALTDTVAFGAYTRAAIDLAGPFDEELVRNQDDEYNYRLRHMGAKILLAADVQCRYYSRSSIGSLWRQYFQYGYWKVRVMQKHPRQMRPRQFVPALFVATIISTLLLLPFSLVGKYLGVMVAASYLIANLTASTLVTRRQGWRFLPLLPIAFATLHLAYGCGCLVGLAKFWNRWGKGRTLSARPNTKVEQV